MQTIHHIAGELIDFAADFLVALPGFAAEQAPVYIPAGIVGVVVGWCVCRAWHNYCDRRAAQTVAEARKWKMDREASVRI